MDQSADLCFVHGVAEPLRPGDFRLCAECGHVWRTIEDYVQDVRELCLDMHWPLPTEQDLPFCPLCSHDW